MSILFSLSCTIFSLGMTSCCFAGRIAQRSDQHSKNSVKFFIKFCTPKRGPTSTLNILKNRPCQLERTICKEWHTKLFHSAKWKKTNEDQLIVYKQQVHVITLWSNRILSFVSRCRHLGYCSQNLTGHYQPSTENDFEKCTISSICWMS